MNKTALWLTDLHVDIKPVKTPLYKLIEEKKPNLIFITGDIADQGRSHPFLENLAERFEIPIYFVLGNHDFYGKEITSFQQLTEELANPHLNYLPNKSPIHLTEKTTLIGIDNFYDMECGDPYNSPVELNDFYYIHNFTGLSKSDIHRHVLEISKRNVQLLDEKLDQAFLKSDEVILLAHVTPFQESCLYNNQHSSKDWSPYFTNTHLGAFLFEKMKNHPEKTLTVLSGHTHHPALFNPLPNLTAKVDGSDTELTYKFLTL